MKKIVLFILFITTLTGCSVDNDNQDSYSFEVLPVDSYTLPEKFILGNTYEIKLKYQRPTECHLFQGIYYDKNLNVRTIAIQTAVNTNQVCTQQIPALSEVSFKFYVTNTGSYIFKFYKGKDAADKDLFEEVEVPVDN
ncbi:membrane lipoprotein lipid attachment site-containing protein [Flavobacterium glaciei]|uniref:Type IV secretion system putative lipoprotein virB7 n=1 Tax=Flavobacterium glaciei TaxID=386300 RepID=A0A562PY59_9FLAO|nr:membrane lipoprotein lipid attachment site-containing protein [Flavobacterium glaciei]RDI56530.1 hypothetical protein DFR66_10493 [Flavobacterium glaciei]TWI49100.1 hypothetical protein IQ02_01086 [Flavobacterium glaciei]